MTRKGKIARFPRHIRDSLNRRLDDGEPATGLVQWLNSHPDVRRVLDAGFDGRPVTEQNLSDWKLGGYLDWQQHQESLEWISLVTDQADEVSEGTGAFPLSDRLSHMAAIALGKVIREISTQAPSDTSRRDDLMRVLRELGRLRREANLASA